MFNNFIDCNNEIDKFLSFTPDQYEDNQIRKRMYTMLMYGTLSNILGNIFDFENIESKNEIDLKRCYFHSNYVGYSEYIGSFIPLVPAGEANIFNEYSKFHSAIGSDDEEYNVYDKFNFVGFNRSFPALSDNVTCYIYASRLADLIISVDCAVISSRILNVLIGNDNQIKEMKLQMQKLNAGVPFMITKKFSEDDFKSVQLQKPELITEFYSGFRCILNEFLMVTGLDAMLDPDKKERLIVDEVSKVDDIKGTILYDKYQNRKAYIDKINERFGTDYKVKINVKIEDIEAFNSLYDFRSEKEVDENA